MMDLRVWTVLAWLLGPSLAIPQVAFPFNSQVPPVARIGQPYDFTLSPTTFSSQGGNLDFSLQRAPAWLAIDVKTGRLYGTPGASDIGSPTFTITASDASGRASISATLVVATVENAISTSELRVSEALEGGGKLSSPKSLLATPNVDFNFKFPDDTFTSSGNALAYYATMADHTPLPSWLAFDRERLTFTGKPPMISASPQTFPILLMASNVPGFASAWVEFNVVVSVHEFHFEEAFSTVSVDSREQIQINHLQQQLVLDGREAKEEDIAKAAAENPQWLQFDAKRLSLEGKPPEDFESDKVSIEVHNKFGDVASKQIDFILSTKLLANNIPGLNLTAGSELHYVFPRSIFRQENLQVTVDLGSAASWLRFDPEKVALSGRVPDISSTYKLEVLVKTSDGAKTDKGTLALQVLGGPSKTTDPQSTTSQTTPRSDGSLTEVGSETRNDPAKSAGMIVGIVIAAILVVGLVVIGTWYLWTRRCEKKEAAARTKKTISRPMYQDRNPCTNTLDVVDEDVEKGSDEFQRDADPPPQIQLNISPFKRPRRLNQPRFPTIMPVPPTHVTPQDVTMRAHTRGRSVASSSINNDDARILDNINRSSWGYEGASRPHDSMKLAVEIARQSRSTDHGISPEQRRMSRMASATRLSLGQTRRSSNNRVVSGGIPVKPRVAGLGHGRSPGARNSMVDILKVQEQNRSPSYADSVTTHSTSVLFSPRVPDPPPNPLRQSKQLEARRQSASDAYKRDSTRLRSQRPVSRRGPRSSFFSAGHSSRGSSSSRKRGTILGLSTIHASPDLDSDVGAPEIQDTPDTQRRGHRHDQSIESYHPLRRNPTMTSEKTTTTWQTVDNGMEDPRQAPPVPERHPAHKRWSSQFCACLSRPVSDPRASSFFADADDRDQTPPATAGAIISTALDDDDVSVYSQSPHASSIFHSATPSPERESIRPLTRGKPVPAGGVRVPPFSSDNNFQTLIMNRPHPRVSIRKASREMSPLEATPQKRIPLAQLRNGENRMSGSGLGLSGLSMTPTPLPLLRGALLKSGKNRRPISVDDPLQDRGVRSVKGSLISGKESMRSGRAQSLSPIVRGDECFL